MRALALLILFFSAQSALADSSYKPPCERDLAETLRSSVMIYNDHVMYLPGKFDFSARAMAAAHIPCIDKLIARARKMDMSKMPYSANHFIAELEWVRDILKQDPNEIFRQVKYYEAEKDDPLARTIGRYLRIWLLEKGYAPVVSEYEQRKTAPAEGADKTSCTEDLAKDLKFAVRYFELVHKTSPGKVDFRVKLMALQNIDCIDDLIALAGKFDMSRMPYAEKHFIAELEWVRDVSKLSNDAIYRQVEQYEAMTDTPDAKLFASRLRNWLEKRD